MEQFFNQLIVRNGIIHNLDIKKSDSPLGGFAAFLFLCHYKLNTFGVWNVTLNIFDYLFPLHQNLTD